VSVKQILGKFLLAFVGGDHSVQCGGRLLWRRLRLGHCRLRKTEHDSCEQGRATQNSPKAFPAGTKLPKPHTTLCCENG
jgi:hypothetical protein